MDVVSDVYGKFYSMILLLLAEPLFKSSLTEGKHIAGCQLETYSQGRLKDHQPTVFKEI